MAFDDVEMAEQAMRYALVDLKVKHMDEYRNLYDAWMTKLRLEQVERNKAAK